jgi:hypothetical protein
LIPPVDQISPPVNDVLLKPAWFACLGGAGRFGGEAIHVPDGHALTSNSSTVFTESKKPPFWASPPRA